MRPLVPASLGRLARSLVAAGLAAALLWPASSMADDLFDRTGLLEDAHVREALSVLVGNRSFGQPEPEAFDESCWKAAADQKSAESQRTACLSAAARLLGSEAQFLVAKGSRLLDAGPVGFVGIGVSIKKTDNGTVVTDLLPQGPAQRAGARVGDRLTHADGAPLADLPIEAVTKLLRGQPGSRVRVEVVSTAGDRRTLDIERAQMTWAAESARNIPGGWYLQVRSTTRDAGQRVQALITQAHAQGELTGTAVLDLRGNTGGLPHEIVDLAQVLLNDDEIDMTLLSITHRNRSAIDRVGNRGRMERLATDPAYLAAQKVFQAMPLLVLTDNQVASGSTWLLATLRARRNTYTMGDTTSTSAVVLQQVTAYGGGEGLFRLPTNYLYAEGAGALHGSGIAPDFARPAEPVLTGEPPTWLQAGLAAHAARIRAPRMPPAPAPGGAAADASPRQCIGPVTLGAGTAPRWTSTSTSTIESRIGLGDTTLYVFTDRSPAEHQATVKERSRNNRRHLAERRQQDTDRIAKLAKKSRLTTAEKAQLQDARARLTHLDLVPEEQVAGFPDASLLTQLDAFGGATSELWWWHDGVAYAFEREVAAGEDLRGLTAWLGRFESGGPLRPEGPVGLCLPTTHLNVPARIGQVWGMVRFKLAATGDSVWVLGFSNGIDHEPDSRREDSVHDTWLLQGNYLNTSVTEPSATCSAYDPVRQQAPAPLSIGNRPGAVVQLDGTLCGHARAAMLPVLGQPDPWRLGFALTRPGTEESARKDLQAWRQVLDTVRWGPVPRP